MTGRTAYEADVMRVPLYHDGTPRPDWAHLGEIARWSWERPVPPLPATELTPAGEQLVIPGCERSNVNPSKPKQGTLWD